MINLATLAIDDSGRFTSDGKVIENWPVGGEGSLLNAAANALRLQWWDRFGCYPATRVRL